MSSSSPSSSRRIRVAILTVSDTAANRGAEFDTSGPLLRSLVESDATTYELAGLAIVPDDVRRIEKAVRSWVEADQEDQQVDWVITTGGTGWSPTDVTPQALRPHLEPLPVLEHHLAQVFLSKTPRSVLSRPLVGLWDGTLVLALPGSKGACKDGWGALTDGPMKDVLRHGIGLLRGGNGEDVHPPRETVKAEGSTSSHSAQSHNHHHDHHRHHHHHHHLHDHHHGHNHAERKTLLSRDPSLNVSARQRESPFPMISFDEALARLESNVSPLATTKRRVDPTLSNHVLAEDVFSPHDLPRTVTTSVDGYAVCVDETPVGKYRVVPARDWRRGTGSVSRINTGGALPPGTDAVVMVEDTRLVREENGRELEIEILAAANSEENVRPIGSDTRQGELVLSKGTVISSRGGEIGALGFVGQRQVLVYRRPVVAVLSTGNELVDLYDDTGDQSQSRSVESSEFSGIVDTNRPGLKAVLEGFGYEVVDCGIARDTMHESLRLFRQAIERADVIVSTGGTSMGEADLLKPMIEHHLNGQIHFGRVSIKPGKPVTYATVPSSSSDSAIRHIFALPGNPASALVCFYLFVLPCLRRLGGWPQDQQRLPRIPVELDGDFRLAPEREEFQRVIIAPSTFTPGRCIARSTGAQQSSRVASMAGANGLVHLPSKEKAGKDTLREGEMVEAVVIGELVGL